MQLREITKPTDTNALLTDASDIKSRSKNYNKKWSTFQLIFLCILVCVISVIASNMDRIIEWIKDTDDSASNSSSTTKTFGHDMFDYFELDTRSQTMYFNWGSEGGIPTKVMEAADDLYHKIAECPNCYYSLDRSNQVTETLELMAEYLGINDPSDLVFVDNASQGINTILRSLSEILYNTKCNRNTTCKILRFNTAYPMVRNTIQFIDNNLASPITQEIIFDITYDMLTDTTLLLNELREFIEQENNGNSTIFIAFISHISASPATIYDVKLINELFREYDIITCIDGAHAMGQIKLNFTEMNPDIYIANGYKWFYSPRSSGLMYVKKEFQEYINPVVISTRNPQTSSFQSKFNWLGLKDYTPWITMKNALEFRREIGDNDIIEYIHNMAIEGGKRVAEIWGTKLYIENEDYIGSLVSVLLPSNANISSWSSSTIGTVYGLWLRVDINNLSGDNVARFSTQIFHEIEDFEEAAYTVLDIINDMNQNNIELK